MSVRVNTTGTTSMLGSMCCSKVSTTRSMPPNVTLVVNRPTRNRDMGSGCCQGTCCLAVGGDASQDRRSGKKEREKL